MKAEAVKDLLKMETSDILLLQETKIEEDALISLSRTKWKKNLGKAIYTDLFHLPSKISLALFNPYVPDNFLEKKDCWNSLPEFLEISAPQNIILARDLNITLDPQEKKEGVRGKDPFHASVESLVLEWDLLDHKPKKDRYTLTNNRVGKANIVARLDRFLVQSTLLEGKHLISSKILPKITSDHNPISLLIEKEEDLGPFPFRFNPLWVSREGFMDIVANVWAQPVEGSPSFV
eukprot:PITA_01799